MQGIKKREKQAEVISPLMWQNKRTGAKVDVQEEVCCLDVGTCSLPLCLSPMQHVWW